MEGTLRRLDRDLKLLAFANLLFALGVGMYLQLLPVYELRLGAPRVWVGILAAIMLGMTALGNIPGAWAAHRFPLRWVIAAVWWLTVPAALSFALAPSWPWLIPGLLLSGAYMANNPAFKSYIVLKSAPERVARNVTLVFGMYPAGLVVAPIIGGALAQAYGMPTVFALSAVLFVGSSSAATMIRDTPYHAAGQEWSLADLRANLRFRRYLRFFLLGFLAVYVGQPFLNPYLSQVHSQDFSALGVYSGLAALGAAILTIVGGRITDGRGPRAGAALTLVALLGGTMLLVIGSSPALWALAMLLCGAYDAFRFIATAMVAGTFTNVPLAWGYAIFDTVMGLPMAGGAILGGVLYRSADSLPFACVIAVSCVLLVALWLAPGHAEEREARLHPDEGDRGGRDRGGRRRDQRLRQGRQRGAPRSVHARLVLLPPDKERR